MGQSVSHAVEWTEEQGRAHLGPDEVSANTQIVHSVRKSLHVVLGQINGLLRKQLDVLKKTGARSVQPGGRLFTVDRFLERATGTTCAWIWEDVLDPATVCVKPTSSASETQIFSAELSDAVCAVPGSGCDRCGASMFVDQGARICEGRMVFGKMFVDDHANRATSACLDQLAELTLYRFATLMVAHGMSPHFVLLEAEVHNCNLQMWLTSGRTPKSLLPNGRSAMSEAAEVGKKHGSAAHIGVMLTEAYDQRVTMTLGNFMHLAMRGTNPEVGRYDLMCVLWQLVHTINIMSDMGVVHGDLHFGNALVTMLPNMQELNYLMDEGRMVSIHTRFFLRIYDWDRSSKVGVDATEDAPDEVADMQGMTVPNYSCAIVYFNHKRGIPQARSLVYGDPNTDKYAVMAQMHDRVLAFLGLDGFLQEVQGDLGQFTYQDMREVGSKHAQIFPPALLAAAHRHAPWMEADKLEELDGACARIAQAYGHFVEALAQRLGAYPVFEELDETYRGPHDFGIRSQPSGMVWASPANRVDYTHLVAIHESRNECENCNV